MFTILKQLSKTEWLMYASFIGVFALTELIVVVLFPTYHSLVWLCFYTAISNFCIPWLPHEPVILLYGNLYNPWLVAVLGGLATCWMEFFNYQILGLITYIQQVKVFTEKQTYQKAEEYFRKFSFFILIFMSLMPVPFVPFRVFAVTSSYPLMKYLLAVFIGRTFRYYILAITGAKIHLPLWTYGLIFVLFLTITLWNKLRKKSKNQLPSHLPIAEQE
jgi:membrane protein YqaA with SNARE-associated domain